MFMVDSTDKKENCFGYTNKDGTIEYVKYDTRNKMVILGVDACGGADVWYCPEDVPKLIKALEHVQKYLVDEGIV